MEGHDQRYSRHVLLAMWGEDGQRRIEQARALVVGLGALGSLIVMLLARAGIGFLRVVDYDAPELHNLHRQILYDEADTRSGRSKAEIAETRLRAAASQSVIEAVNARVGPDTVRELVAGVDVVVDALDNIESRYYVNDAILDRGIPYVFGGAIEASGNVMTVIPGKTPCLRCLWPDPKSVMDHPRASDVGVLSSAATATASMQVTETMKILVGRQEDLIDGLLVMDFWHGRFRVARVEPDPACRCRARERP